MTYNTQGIVIKSYAWPRKARLYILYTNTFGKIKVVAAGSQKVTSKVAGHLQPFSQVEIMVARGRTFDRLAQSRTLKNYPALQNDIHLYALGSYVLELLDQFTQEGISDHTIWQYVHDVFAELNSQGHWQMPENNWTSLQTTVRIFALQLLDRFGFRPELYQCVSCKEKIDELNTYFSLTAGGVICQGCQTYLYESALLHPELLKYLRMMVNQSFNDLTKVVVSEKLHQNCQVLIDQLVAVHLQKPLKSAQFFATLQSYGT